MRGGINGDEAAETDRVTAGKGQWCRVWSEKGTGHGKVQADIFAEGSLCSTTLQGDHYVTISSISPGDTQ